jgi:hypothetical protein
MEDTRWDHALKVTGGGRGLVGHAGAVLLRKAADQAGLTVALGAALRKAGTSPVLDRGVVLVSLAAAIALGAASMSDIAVLAHLAPVLGDAPSGPTVRRALDLAGGTAMLDRVARARARARAHVWTLIEDTPAGFPWLAIAGKALAGWLVIDMDATLVTARSGKQGAAPTWKKGYGLLTELPELSSQFREWLLPGTVTVPDHDRTRRSSSGYGEPCRGAGWFPSGHRRSMGSVSAGRSVG